MKRLKNWLGLTAAVAIVCASGAAHAARVGVFIGGGYPLYFPVAPVPYYYPPVVAVPAPAPAPQPPEYVEQGQAGMGQYDEGSPDAGPQQPAGVWYYCDASRAYYPYVKQCGAGWREVPARPPAPGN